MLKGTICKAAAIAGTAVLRIVVSSDSIKNATATSHGSKRFVSKDLGETMGLGSAIHTAYFIFDRCTSRTYCTKASISFVALVDAAIAAQSMC